MQRELHCTQRAMQPPLQRRPRPRLPIGWPPASSLSITQCKQGADWPAPAKSDDGPGERFQGGPGAEGGGEPGGCFQAPPVAPPAPGGPRGPGAARGRSKAAARGRGERDGVTRRSHPAAPPRCRQVCGGAAGNGSLCSAGGLQCWGCVCSAAGLCKAGGLRRWGPCGVGGCNAGVPCSAMLGARAMLGCQAAQGERGAMLGDHAVRCWGAVQCEAGCNAVWGGPGSAGGKQCDMEGPAVRGPCGGAGAAGPAAPAAVGLHRGTFFFK